MDGRLRCDAIRFDAIVYDGMMTAAVVIVVVLLLFPRGRRRGRGRKEQKTMNSDKLNDQD
jgi:hypothetical protein